MRHSVSLPDETPRSSSKIICCASYLRLSSRCFRDETRNLMLDILRHKETMGRNQPSKSDSWFHASFEHCDDILMVDRGRGHSKIVIDLLNIIGK